MNDDVAGRSLATGRRSRPTLAALAVLLALALTGGWWLDHGGPIVLSRTLRARPEAMFFYPGSTVIGTNWYNDGITLTGPRRASYTTVLTTDAGDETILGFYETRMRALPGWAPTAFNANTGTRGGRAWTDGRVMLSIRLPDPRYLLAAGLTGPNFYQVEIFALSPR